jgi:hypothetical protein
VLTAEAIFAEARGDMEELRDLYQEAAQRWAYYGFVLEEGQAHLGFARCLIALATEKPGPSRSRTPTPSSPSSAPFPSSAIRSPICRGTRFIGMAS